MKLDRSKNAIRNIKTGLLEKIVLMICPFIVRTVFIYTLGADYLGLNSLFSSILIILNMTELGIGSAIIFSMYQAIAADDFETINALLHYYRHLYRRIGLIMLGLGAILIPFLPYLIHGEVPADINLIAVYLIFLIDSACGYFIFAHYTSLFYAFQRNDVLQIVNIVVSFLKYASQCFILLVVRNYYVFAITMPVFTAINSLVIGIAAKKGYPEIRPHGSVSKDTIKKIRERVSGVLADKILGIARNSFDTVFVSMFFGLAAVAVYGNHLYVMNAITSILLVLLSAIVAGIGNSIAIESVEKNYSDMKRINFIYMWLASCCTVCLICLYSPFMKLWAGEEMVLPMSSVILFSSVFYILKMCDVRYTYVQGTGLWKEIRPFSIAEAILNIVLNYVLGKRFGINGIILATAFSLFAVNFCLRSTVLFGHYFSHKELKEFYSSHCLYALVTAVICFISYYVCSHLPETWLWFGVRIVICALLSNILLMISYRRTKIYKQSSLFLAECLGIRKESSIYKLLVS
jgi:O-antigen/teichoic acid export membrane protein